MGDVAAFVAQIQGLREPNAGAIRALAKDAQNFPNSVEVIADVLEQKVQKTKEEKALLAAWYLIDAMAKTTKFGRSRIAPALKDTIVRLASEFIPWGNADMAGKYSKLVDTWRSLFGDESVERILSARDKAAPLPPRPAPEPPRAPAKEAPIGEYPEPPRSDTVPPPRAPRGPREPMAPQGKLTPWEERFGEHIPDRPPQVDEIAPPLPAEIPVAVPRPAPGAPIGHVKAPPVDHHQNYINERKGNLWHILQAAKRKREARAQNGNDGDDEEDKVDPDERNPKRLRAAMKKKIEKLIVKHRFRAPKVDETKWPQMPATFPRCAETDVQLGNYVDGVIFIRDAIRESGGALELTRLNTKIPEVRSVANRVKNIREFIDIHTPTTFAVTKEEGRIIVRLSEDPPPKAGDTPSWLGVPCPDCGKVVPGHNLAKHRTSKGCVAMQMLLGKEKKGSSPIAKMAEMSYAILEHAMESGGDPGLDDDDLEHFGLLIHQSADKYRFKLARKNDVLPMVRAVRAVHAFWLRSKGAESSAEAKLGQDDCVMVRFLEKVGSNLYRLPLSYLDFGEFEWMCGPFVTEFIPPPPKPPRFGSTKVRPKECPSPGLVFCDSDRDSDNPPDSDRESDDELDKDPEVSAPLTMSQVLSTVGTKDQGNKKKILQMAASTIQWKYNSPIHNLAAAQALPQIGGPQQSDGVTQAHV